MPVRSQVITDKLNIDFYKIVINNSFSQEKIFDFQYWLGIYPSPFGLLTELQLCYCALR